MSVIFAMLHDLWVFIASGFRDALLEAVFASVLTAFFIILFARMTGKRLSSVAVGGLNLKFAAKEAENAFEQRGSKPPPKHKLYKGLELISGNWQVLWVDDHPEWIRHEMEALAALGFSFRVARNNEQAINYLEGEFFHLIISDIARDHGESGIELPTKARSLVGDVPIIFYVGRRTANSTDEGYPVVVSPDELFREIAIALGVR